MQFQSLDNKKQCVGVYADGEMHFEKIPEDLTHTWNYASFLSDSQIEYAQLYCSGQTLDEVCPEHLSDRWVTVRGQLMAHYKAFSTALISLDEHCFFDMVPEQFLHDYCEIKDQITSWVFENYERPENYDFLVELHKLSDRISEVPFNLDFTELNDVRYKTKVRDFIGKFSGRQQHCRYNVWGTKTGRLTTVPNSFPIMTLPKQYRSIIKPNNEWLLELDYNAAELRTVLALSGKDQPEEDIHEWNIENIFKGKLTRDEAKTNIFAWLYGSSNLPTIDGDITKTLSEVYRKEEIVRQHWTGLHVRTRFGRTIPSDNHHALSYIIQSSTVDIALRRVIELDRFLRDTDSRVAFTLHDSVVIDLADRDRRLVPRMIEIFSDTELGRFKTNVSAGRDFGNMKRLKIAQN